MTAEEAQHFEVRDNGESRTYEVEIDGRSVATLVYENAGNRVVIRHTIVEPEYRGRGIAAALVDRALRDARAQGKTVSSSCSYATQYIDDHPEYADLVD